MTPTIGQRRRSKAIPAKKQAEPVKRSGCTKNVRARPIPYIEKRKKQRMIFIFKEYNIPIEE